MRCKRVRNGKNIWNFLENAIGFKNENVLPRWGNKDIVEMFF